MADSAQRKRLTKVLVANRGEIACRIIRGVRELGIETVAVYSEADRESLHVQLADEAFLIGPAPSQKSYLRQDKLIEVALGCGADGIHPGYGFLSERPNFARDVEAAGINWIGPPATAIEAMGEKVRARKLMTDAGVPVVPGTKALEDARVGLEAAESIGFPVLIKASAGGGGKGMRLVENKADFEAAFASARRESLAAFDSDEVYVEKFIINPRHVEFQVAADKHGNVVHLLERDCSVQRRHQKVVEETPCPVLRQDVRERMGEVAVRAAEAVDYFSVGTIEFLLDSDQNFYFLEMNTRLQVEHPVTELVTGVDLVTLQIRIAEGDPLPFTQSDISARGSSIEVRIYAEDPLSNFMPSPGTLTSLRWPEGPGVRVDSGVYEGFTVTPHYDPIMAKLIVWAPTRDQAIARLERALSDLVVGGLRSNGAFLREVLRHPEFRSGVYDIGFLGRHLEQIVRRLEEPEKRDVAVLAALVEAYRRDHQRRPGGVAAAAQQGEGGWHRYGLWRRLGR